MNDNKNTEIMTTQLFYYPSMKQLVKKFYNENGKLIKVLVKRDVEETETAKKLKDSSCPWFDFSSQYGI